MIFFRRVLKVRVTDIDDHPPVFDRQRVYSNFFLKKRNRAKKSQKFSSFFSQNSVPQEMVLEEEVPPGTEVGRVRARDEDEGENAAVDFAIVDGDDDGVFDVVPDPREDKGVGVVLTRGRVDRERREEYLLTVR